MRRSTFIPIMIVWGLALLGAIPQRCQGPVTNDRPWLEESEFLDNPLLHATSDQTIVFDLEPSVEASTADEGNRTLPSGADRGNHHKLIRNTVSFLVRDTDANAFSFCIPKDEPYVSRLEVEPASGGTILRTRPGDDCEALVLEPGRYRLHVYHDGFAVGASGRKAFLHRPQRPRTMGATQTGSPKPSFIALRGPNGQFVTDDTATPLQALMTTATTVGPHEVWRLGSVTSNIYTLTSGAGGRVLYAFDTSDYFTGKSGGTDFLGDFAITDLGNSQVNLKLNTAYVSAKVGVGGNLTLFATSGNLATFTVDYKGIDCTTCDASAVPLQEGEVALFAGCNYTGPAIIFQANVPDMSIYNAAAAQHLGMGDNMAASVRVGPNTFAVLYADASYAGQVQGIQEDTACLDSTPLGNAAASSFEVTTDIRQYVIDSNSCLSCNLSGLDLSGLNLTGGSFEKSVFTEANLTKTNFHEAHLDGASFAGPGTSLDGTDFSDATLECTVLSDNDLTTAVFDDNPNLAKDFSCRLDLSGTRMSISAMPFADWRYLDLKRATLINDTGSTPVTLSTIDNPLDLSGGILSGVTGLSGVLLDGANLGCTTNLQGEQICTELIGINLSQTSLIKASLTNAALNGASLNFANLTEADLSGAQLLKAPESQTSATLEGAYLKNANLSYADLSGVNLSNANWYSTFISAGGCPGSTWMGSCASGEGATLNSTNFEAAYLSGVDLNSSTPQGANFSGAVLLGANFTGANLSRDPDTGVATNFSGAFIQGADFTDAIVTGANFLSAYVDQAGSGSRLFLLPEDNHRFTGFSPSAGSVAGCVEASYPTATTVPEDTTSDNTCPDDTPGACSDEQWQNPFTKIENASPPSTGDMTQVLPEGCTGSTEDNNWNLQ